MSDNQLIEATKNGDSVGVAGLIQAGADLNQQDDKQWTALCWAAGRGDIDIVQQLVNAGADLFRTGADRRTPYLIALAAGRAAVALFLRDAEEKSIGGPRPRSRRQYCRSYSLRTLREFAGWSELPPTSSGRKAAAGAASLSDPSDAHVYLHQDLTVTRSIWHGEDVIFDKVMPEWEAFCSSVLDFHVPDDLDLISTLVA
jgi:hypothetical protein